MKYFIFSKHNLYDISLIQYSIYTIIGLLAGVSMGTIGIGAGIISIPLLIYSGLNPQSAVGVSLVMQTSTSKLTRCYYIQP